MCSPPSFIDKPIQQDLLDRFNSFFKTDVVCTEYRSVKIRHLDLGKYRDRLRLNIVPDIFWLVLLIDCL